MEIATLIIAGFFLCIAAGNGFKYGNTDYQRWMCWAILGAGLTMICLPAGKFIWQAIR